MAHYLLSGGGSKLGAPDIERLMNSIREFGETDISHDELGSANGFHEAERTRKAILNYFLELLDILLEVVEDVDTSVREFVIKRINDEGEALRKIEDEIERLAKEGVHTQEFPSAREEQIRVLRERGGAVKLTLQPYEAAIRVKRLEKRSGEPPASDTVAETERIAHERLAELERLVTEAGKSLGNLQAKVMNKGVDEAVNAFGKLSSTHAAQERNWFRAFFIAAASTLLALGYVFLAPHAATNALEFAAGWVRNVLLLSVPAVFARIALAKYNLERNLRIIYAHREAVLAQYRIFETAIGDDAVAKNQFRLEIAKYIFSDPVTGYVASDVSSEININPMVGLLEKAAGK